MRIAIIEDEESEYRKLNNYIKQYSQETGEAFEVEHFSDAVDFVSDYHAEFDLIFLDIMLPHLDGMNAAERIRKVDENVEIIFITNMAQYAIQGYNVSARYFILKPVEYADFAKKFAATVSNITIKNKNEFIMLDLPSEKRKVFVKNIKYVEIFAHDVVFHTLTEDIHVRGTLTEFEMKLDSKKFCRINSCYIVNLDFVTAVKERTVFIGDTELRISYGRKKSLMQALADYVNHWGC